ncbi:hypothetical protein B0T22DRAFT_536202 [Podospora appendiculata]|uniref:Uncharacterized protein n=1 Tax=Podospora appendiculata TaxID=314037 RepID=A0AAE0XAP9_9PEZI|nr:hypothetical protein B0T22DRAFT_536202 [Podospora appendiculata]
MHERGSMLCSMKNVLQIAPPFVNVFWRARRPKPRPRPNGDGFIQDEWPFEDECHNVALLEKLKWLTTTADADRPLPILRRPKTSHDIAANLRGFSDEARDSPLSTRLPDDPIPIPPSRTMSTRTDWHWALVYELVPGAPQDLAVGQAHLDFFYAMAFAIEAHKPDNWRGGRLVGFSDVSAPFSTGWRRSAIVLRDVGVWFSNEGCGQALMARRERGRKVAVINQFRNGNPIYPSANFRPFFLFATPLNEVSGVTDCCSALLNWLPRPSAIEAQLASDGIKLPKSWESPVTPVLVSPRIQAPPTLFSS